MQSEPGDVLPNRAITSSYKPKLAVVGGGHPWNHSMYVEVDSGSWKRKPSSHRCALIPAVQLGFQGNSYGKGPWTFHPKWEAHLRDKEVKPSYISEPPFVCQGSLSASQIKHIVV